jgi:Glycine cleavage system regulatory protein
LTAIIAQVEAGDAAAIERFFRTARTFRDRLPERRPGALPMVHELFVDVPDRPGVIGRIATLLGEHGINLVNLEVLEVREDIFGVLRLVFSARPIG